MQHASCIFSVNIHQTYLNVPPKIFFIAKIETSIAQALWNKLSECDSTYALCFNENHLLFSIYEVFFHLILLKILPSPLTQSFYKRSPYFSDSNLLGILLACVLPAGNVNYQLSPQSMHDE